MSIAECIYTYIRNIYILTYIYIYIYMYVCVKVGARGSAVG